MGGGISSLSKVCVVGPPSRDDADIDYTFAQIGLRNTNVSFAAKCGNMLAAKGRLLWTKVCSRAGVRR